MDERDAPPVARRRIVIYYALLIAAVAAAAGFALARGGEETTEPVIAGGYDVAQGASCLGPAVNLVQSGRFVELTSTGGGSSDSLDWENGMLTGTVQCAEGGSAQLRARVPGSQLIGTLAGAPVRALFKRDPPAPGTPAPRAPDSVAGTYSLAPAPACLGGTVELKGGGEVAVSAGDTEAGTLAYSGSDGGTLSGELTCKDGSARQVLGIANDRTIELTLAPEGTQIVSGKPPPAGSERAKATQTRELTNGIAALLIAVVVAMLFARLVGTLMPKIGQPRVMGEVLAGILLGPTLLGALAPELEAHLFPSDVVPYIGVVANLGLVFYMFLVGLELDLRQLRGRLTQTLVISNTGVAIPMAFGMLVAIPVYELLAPDTSFAGFALFMGVSMSITAFPVLARIIVERRMVKRPLGVLALAAAATDDVTAWVLVALASSVAVSGASAGVVGRTIALTVGFALLMGLLGRRILERAAVSYDEAGSISGAWVTAIFAGVLLSAYATESIGIGLIFGGFVSGLVMPRHAGLTEHVTQRIEDFVVTVLLPLFFVFTGLRTNILTLARPELLLLTLGLCVVAISCKFGGTLLAARVTRLRWRESAVLATLMNTRGLTELIVLNLALDQGVISQALFSSLVLMALVTTFMAGPILRLLDRENRYGAPLGEELEQARQEQRETPSRRPLPERSILLAPQAEESVAQLRSLAQPLGTSEPRRELIFARLLKPTRGAGVRGGLQTESRALESASRDLNRICAELIAEDVDARAAVFTSTEPGRDLVRLAEREPVDLLMLDGGRPLLGSGVPRGDVGTVLRDAPCDVAVLVTRDNRELLAPGDGGVLVPFGGAEHDWAALELAAWISSAHATDLHLLGREDTDGSGRDASRLLANASLLVQQFAGIAAEPQIAAPGRDGVIQAAGNAALLVIGLSENWRKEGLGETRSAIVRAAPAPILLVRRGSRPGALAPREDVTRFSWSSPAVGIPHPEA